MKSLIIVNPADCIGCRTCEVACVVAHPSEQELNADVFLPRLKVQRLDSISAPVMCHQCENAPCVGACPVGALTMGEQVVQANSARCIGCQSCVSACPFGMITIQSLPGDTRQQIVKCDLCEQGTVAKLAMRQPFVLFKGLTFQKLCLPGAFRPGDHHNKMLRPG
ncbi:4Fe-4S dicluster domain-containing protein, partial [Escherichia coli]|uniref:4Fe-4S dicluster domain-containing protein n=1 Tax=Escherichia coli TaxID=562 RepID=UPI003BF52172